MDGKNISRMKDRKLALGACCEHVILTHIDISDTAYCIIAAIFSSTLCTVYATAHDMRYMLKPRTCNCPVVLKRLHIFEG